MRNRSRKMGWTLAATMLAEMLCVGAPAQAQVKTYTPGEYPAPKDPPYKVNATVEDLLPIAQVLVRKPAERQPLEPGYGIKPGQRVLILVATTFDDRVLEAIRRAIEELGGKPDVLKTWTAQQARMTRNQGHEEIERFAALGAPPVSDFRKDVTVAGKYDLLLNGSGGPIPITSFGWEYIPWDTADKFMFSQAGLPYEVQHVLDQKAWDLLLRSRQIHNTDPEGTDMTWDWHPNFVGLLREEWPNYSVVLAGHISPFPLLISPKEANANGTIGGTINHTGTFPHILLTIRNNEIAKVEGGGEYGKLWQEMLESCRGIQYPGFPAPGCGWFEESSVGTDPWRARALKYADYSGDSWERGRTGVIHWGLGVSRNTTALPAVQKWLQDNKTKAGGGHWHVHTYFNTMDYTLNDGKQFRLIDKGHLTLLDDPEVRKIAAKYGNPDEILKEKWIPGIPGINMPGSYMTDYGRDPYKVIAAQLAEIKSKAQMAESQTGSEK
ncbi:MAG: hypothetical protein HYX73_07625 [Acidobacteria bacterium]|nr:hypothetical protein [Acidobacteriota bacterium]